jgi:hypothetical protein
MCRYAGASRDRPVDRRKRARYVHTSTATGHTRDDASRRGGGRRDQRRPVPHRLTRPDRDFGIRLEKDGK